MTEIRCTKCNKLLTKASEDGIIRLEIKCPRCGELNEINMNTEKERVK